MNKVFKNVLGAMGFSTEDEENFNEEYETPKPRVERTAKASEVSSFSETSGRRNKVVSMSATTQFKVVVIKPANFDDAKEIADHLKDRKPVVVNLELLEKDVAHKIFDFLSGAIYVLDGGIQRVSNNIYLIAPYNVTILGDFKNELKNNTFLWD
ncbi:MAG: cell division protein SepF [Ruminococcaceae bacterium]|jgi:cell division inhibitor SepF|nr:cell division protein SepF [Oscillospiraceae bacterium]